MNGPDESRRGVPLAERYVARDIVMRRVPTRCASRLLSGVDISHSLCSPGSITDISKEVNLACLKMASIDKLAVRGIRSFDDKQISVIEFFTPVTVIVGHNGSGKTTIIECLKYATTGDQPPNTRGGAFVHDPKMANEKEVKAQVKLRFYAANHNRMLAVRNLSVTMKKNGALTMKTLESILALADEKKGKVCLEHFATYFSIDLPRREGLSRPSARRWTQRFHIC